MKLCLSCQETVAEPNWTCPQCGYSPPQQDGILLFSQHLAEHCQGFDAELFPHFASMEARHFWHRTRNRLIQWMFGKHFPQAESFLEVGCGTGYVLSGLQEAFPRLQLYGSEAFPQGLQFAAERLPGVALWQMDARQLPFREEFDVIGAFDVLEHIEEDEQVLEQLFQAVRPGGGIMLTVPQHQWLWSEADVRVHHVRRYEGRDLLAKVRRAGFEPVQATSFVSLLLFPMWLSRLMQPANREAPLHDSHEFDINPVLNQVFEAVMNVEIQMIKAGFTFPVGGSFMLVAKKPA